MNKRQEGYSEFVVSRGDAAEETLDQVVALVDMLVERTRVEPVGAWRDHRLAALRRNCFDEGIRIVTLVGHDEFGRLILNQCRGLLDIGDLVGREDDS